MEERFYREQEIARLPAFLSAATYNLAHTLLARARKCLFVPIRSMQYMAVLDGEEFIFVDSRYKAGQREHRQAEFATLRPIPATTTLIRWLAVKPWASLRARTQSGSD